LSFDPFIGSNVVLDALPFYLGVAALFIFFIASLSEKMIGV